MRNTLQQLLLLCCLSAVAASAQPKRIVLGPGDPKLIAEWRAVTPLAEIIPLDSSNRQAELARADGYIGEITPAELAVAKNLKWVQVMSAGVERLLFRPGGEALRQSNVVLTNNKIVQGPEIADHALALLLMMSRGLYTFYSAKPQGVLHAHPYHGIELNGKTAVVIGVGGIGTQIAIRASAFGMHVIGVDPEDKPLSPFLERVVKPDQLDEVLPLADVVFISVPDTPRSHKMMGPRQFELMKQQSYFVAVSRGGIYDLNGLVKALDEKRLAGAGVDVTDPEPLPPSHALWKFDNVIITPHIAGRSDRDAGRMTGTIKENIRRFAEGKPLLNVVDKQKGY